MCCQSVTSALGAWRHPDHAGSCPGMNSPGGTTRGDLISRAQLRPSVTQFGENLDGSRTCRDPVTVVWKRLSARGLGRRLSLTRPADPLCGLCILRLCDQAISASSDLFCLKASIQTPNKTQNINFAFLCEAPLGCRCLLSSFAGACPALASPQHPQPRSLRTSLHSEAARLRATGSF